MESAPKKRSSLLRFSLRTFLVFTLVACVGMAWWRDRLQFQERIAILEEHLAIKSKEELPAWHAAQATGPPDASAGDHPRAWASATPDGQAEWLEVRYSRPVRPVSIIIHETYNPGAVHKISVFRRDGSEFVVWQGTDPVPTTSPQGVARLAIKVPFRVDRVKIYVDSVNFPGWNEIDAVGLVDARGRVYWASVAEASSIYGSTAFGGMQNALPIFPTPQSNPAIPNAGGSTIFE